MRFDRAWWEEQLRLSNEKCDQVWEGFVEAMKSEDLDLANRRHQMYERVNSVRFYIWDQVMASGE